METTSQTARERAVLRQTNARRALASGGFYMPEYSKEGTLYGAAGGEAVSRLLISDPSSYAASLTRGSAERAMQGKFMKPVSEVLRAQGGGEDWGVRNDRRRSAAWRTAMSAPVVGRLVGNLIEGEPSQITDRWFQQTPYEREISAQQDAPMMEPPELLEAPSKKRAFEEI